MSTYRASFLGLVAVFLAGPVLGSEAIPNWPAPAMWSSPRARGATTMSETNPLPFQAVTPCRVADTRGNGFPGQYGPPSLIANATRSFTITGRCGIPASAAAVSFNFGALNVGGTGDLRVFPAGGSVPLVSTLNYNANTPNIANAAIVELGGGAITVQADTISIDLIIDVNGYYVNTTLAPSERFTLSGNTGGALLEADNSSNSGSSYGVAGVNFGAGFASAGVAGASWATSGLVYGVAGYNNGSTTATAAGVYGKSGGATGSTYGVFGVDFSTSADAAGVKGVDASGDAFPPPSYVPAGVRGDSASNYGVLGVSRNQGVAGSVVSTAGTELAYGILGYNAGIVYAVYAGGSYGSSGAKFFVEPHPTDASKVIRYVSLEGPEAGTYFRGRGRFQDGLATIDVPEDFRMVTDPEGLSIQVTPIGEFANVAVVRIELDGIVVKASRNVEFFYTVNGVRKTQKDLKPVGPGTEFMPRSADAKMPAYLTEGQKAMLISNGTYKEDGTVNMETAERLGWTKIWADREAETKAAPDAAARASVIRAGR